jgi:hypothetical protein
LPRSVLLQPAQHVVTSPNSQVRYRPGLEIVDVQDMVHERIEAWRRNQERELSRVVFYRKGLDIVKNGFFNAKTHDIVQRQVYAIENAIKAEYSDAPPTLMYTLVNKRRQPDSPYGRVDITKYPNDHGVEQFSVSASSVRTSKYKYYIMKDTRMASELYADNTHQVLDLVNFLTMLKSDILTAK